MTDILLGICLILLIVLIIIALRNKRLEPLDVKNAVSNMLIETGLGEKITRIEKKAAPFLCNLASVNGHEVKELSFFTKPKRISVTGFCPKFTRKTT